MYNQLRICLCISVNRLRLFKDYQYLYEYFTQKLRIGNIGTSSHQISKLEFPKKKTHADSDFKKKQHVY